VAIFKNEAANLREWLTHYVEQGIEVFFLLDNGSTDSWQDELEGFEDMVTVVSSDLRHAQTIEKGHGRLVHPGLETLHVEEEGQ
jgi:hypothetical protein